MSRQAAVPSSCTNKVIIKPARLAPVFTRGHVYQRVLSILRKGNSDHSEPKQEEKRFSSCSLTNPANVPAMSSSSNWDTVPINMLTNSSVRNQTVALFQQPIPATCLSTPAQQQEKVCTPKLDGTAERHLSALTDGLRDNEITMLLSCGSTSGPTDRTSVPEGLLIGGVTSSMTISESAIKDRLETIKKIYCYDAHRILNYLYNKYQLSLIDKADSCLLMDVKIAGYLLSPEDPPNSLETLMQRYGTDVVANRAKSNINVQDLSILADCLGSKLKEYSLTCVFDIEMKVAPILAGMEYYGVLVNTSQLVTYLDDLKSVIKSLEVEARDTVGHTFSLTSTSQLREVLFTELCLDRMCTQSLQVTSVNKVTSTSEAVLVQLSEFHPLPGIVLQYRQCLKVKGFVESLLSHTSPAGSLNPKWLSDRTVTGRLACSSPNMQAFPKHSYSYELPGILRPRVVSLDIRSTIISRPGTSFITLDFKSIELRLLAHFSKDESLASIIAADASIDVFVSLASQWLRLSPDRVTGKERERVKRVVYAIIYGVGKEKLAELIQSTPSSAQELVKSFLRTYPGISNFMQKTLDYCRSNKFCVSLCGRKRWFPLICSTDYQTKTSLERQAINFVIQGSAADVCKISMIRINNALSKTSPSAKLLLQIHDELLYEVPNEDVPVVTDLLKQVAESPNLLKGYCQPLIVPLAVRISIGKNWS
ncbi:PREDICTED: DNA polymerase nu-like [Amphimedon queenslandica]|uniref:DNA-directed DNA polymerase n=1 Tax=Amphimedon queenslandica TaxID=400682 RepID=A0A1X7VDB4_AMPQE|nr:PREDICTED: DNA polymerase nu-like [Amphimedon queenslandica]XP_019849760.1 PREDICTED: DNA polymerase nu-like [Amphimedon queenslandica]|eukprot:XP_019849759.1 PREDICTED: DNA polymerase nu-like [Amphimedon queenslandica]